MFTAMATAADVIGELEGIDSESNKLSVSGQSYDFVPNQLSADVSNHGAINLNRLVPGLKVKITLNDNKEVSHIEVLGPKEKIDRFYNQ